MNNRGISIIEALMVLGILLIFSSLGTNAYRKMEANSRRAELKTALSNICRSERTFYAEFRAFGNNLKALGVRNVGHHSDRRYVVGFPEGNDPQGRCIGAKRAQPSQGTYQASKIKAHVKGYYDQYRPEFSLLSGPNLPCAKGYVSNDGYEFRATATGIDHSKDAPDVWQMGENCKIVRAEAAR